MNQRDQLNTKIELTYVQLMRQKRELHYHKVGLQQEIYAHRYILSLLIPISVFVGKKLSHATHIMRWTSKALEFGLFVSKMKSFL